MQITISRNAANKIKEILVDIDTRLIIDTAICQSCVGSGISMSFWDDEEDQEKYIFGNSNDIKWACRQNDAPVLDGTEIDFRSDDSGEYFVIYNQGRYIPFSPEGLFAFKENGINIFAEKDII